MLRSLPLLLAGLASLPVHAQTLSIEDYEPRSILRVPENRPTSARFPFIDVHSHQRDLSPERLTQLVREMDSLNLRILINSPVGGGHGAWVTNAIAAMKGHDPARFAVMTNIDYTDLGDPDYPERAAAQLEADIRAGAIGVKVWKHLGMMLHDRHGRVPVDDPRFDRVWEVCARHNVPVLIHTADPWGLFQPMDRYNERWLELKLRANRNQSQQGDYTWEQLIAEQHNLFARHPRTTFIAAHLGWLGHDLGRLGDLFDRLPNVYAEIGAITSELGRQPRAAHRFLVRYQDRILFGKDAYNVEEYHVYFRLLETDDDYFDPIRKYHGIWKLYGLDLPDEVLKKIYYQNALRIFPGLPKEGFPD